MGDFPEINEERDRRVGRVFYWDPQFTLLLLASITSCIYPQDVSHNLVRTLYIFLN